MEKDINVKFSLKDFFKTLGELMWNSDDTIEEDEKLPKELQEVSDKMTKKAESLTDVKLPKSKSRTKVEDSSFAKNVHKKEVSAQKQVLNNPNGKDKKNDIKDREIEE